MTDARRIEAPYGEWDPAPLSDVVAKFAGVACPWWVAGGFAIELAVGRRFRDHADIDVLLLRRDQLVAQQVLAGWEWWAADPPGILRPWSPGEVLPPSVHDIWCRPGPDAPWRIQFMLDESSGPDWVPRRDPRMRRPISTIGLTSAHGIPYLAPEIQLYYKARNVRPKDQVDFDTTLPVLTDHQRQWLIDALTVTHGPHPWLTRLQASPHGGRR